MKDVATGGRTVLFVSHNMTAVRNLCSKAIWLDKGRVVEVGEVYPVTQRYIEKSRSSSPGNGGHPSWTNGEFRLIEATVSPANGQTHELRIDEENVLTIRFEVLRSQARANLSIHVFSDEGVCAFNTYTAAQTYAPGTYEACCQLPAHLFNDSTYQIGIMFVERETPSLNIPSALQIEFSEVRRKGTEWLGKFPGILRPALSWKIEAD